MGILLYQSKNINLIIIELFTQYFNPWFSYLKYGWCNAAFADILFVGSYVSILFNKSNPKKSKFNPFITVYIGFCG